MPVQRPYTTTTTDRSILVADNNILVADDRSLLPTTIPCRSVLFADNDILVVVGLVALYNFVPSMDEPLPWYTANGVSHWPLNVD